MTGMSPTPGTQVGGVSTVLSPSTNNFNMTGTTSSDSGSHLTTPSALGAGGWGGGGFEGGGSPSAIDTSDSSGGFGGGWGGGGLAAGRSDPYSGDWRDQANQNPTGAGVGFSAGGFGGGGFTTSFAAGGAIDDGDSDDPNATDPQGSAMGNSLQQSINKALSTVSDVLSYGRSLHGISGQKTAMNDEGFRQSSNVDDRTGNDTSPDANSFGESMKRRVGSRMDEVKGMFASDQTKNKMSQDAGINDIGSSGSPQAGAQQAISTDEEEPE